MTAPHGGAPGAQRPLTVAAVLRRFLPGFLTRGPVSPHTAKVLRRLSLCHTGELGWALWQCDHCQGAHWRPLGCGDRHCADCQIRPRQAWLEKQRRALLPVRYFHWVFTLPAGLRPLALQNQQAIYTLLFECASATLLQFGQERLGARLGITALLHTWGQTLGEHPHLHCLVTGGGLVSPPEDPPVWSGPKQAQYLFPVRAVAAMFAGKFLAGLQVLRATGRLQSWRDPAQWASVLSSWRQAKWVVFGQGSVVGPEAVLDYLGRYTHRVALSNGRLLRLDQRTVTFRYKDYRQEGALRESTLDGVEFVRRLSLHILPSGFTKIRHYGILGNNQRARQLPLARLALQNSPWRWEKPPPVSERPPAPAPEPARCPRCGSDELTCVGRLDWTGRFFGQQRGALRLRLRTGEPWVQDSS